MPNWVYNKITIEGKNENIERFLSDSKKDQNGQMTFSSWIPIPETFKKYDTTNYPNGKGLEIGKSFTFKKDRQVVTKELIDEYKAATKLQREQYGVVGWYEYNCLTYGCKWDCTLDVESKADNELILNCETPWNAPIQFFITISNRYPELTFNICSDSIENGTYKEFMVEKGNVTLLKNQEYVYEEDLDDISLVDVDDNIDNSIIEIDYGKKLIEALESFRRFQENKDKLAS